jgi:hypothetical protein
LVPAGDAVAQSVKSVLSLAKQVPEDLKPLEAGHVALRLELAAHEGFHWVSLAIADPEKRFESTAIPTGRYSGGQSKMQFFIWRGGILVVI